MFTRNKVLSLLALSLLMSTIPAGLFLSNQVNASSSTSDSTEENMLFFDDFNGSNIDLSKWDVVLNTQMNDNPAYGGAVKVNNSYVEFSSTGSTFPWVCTKENPFPTTGDFTVKLDITYSGISDFGNGIIITGGEPLTVRTSGSSSATTGIIQLWADNDQSYNRSKLVIYLVGREVWRSYVMGWEPDAPTINFELNYVNGTYKLNIDGKQVATAESDIRPNSIGLGHAPTYYLPFSAEHLSTLIGGWTKFKIDTIEVLASASAIEPEPSECTSPTPTASEPCTPQPSVEVQVPVGFAIESNSIVSAFAFDSSSGMPQISFNVSGPDGTTGYVKLTIAKSFMPNSNMTIYLDGNQTPYDLEANDNGWIVTFTYHHSTHQVKINSSVNLLEKTTALPDWIVYAAIVAVALALIAASGVLVWLARQGKSEKQL